MSDEPGKHGTPAEYFDRTAHRVVVCSAAEKNAAAGQPAHICPSDFGADMERDEGSSAAAGNAQNTCDLDLDYSKYPLPKDLFLRSPLILNVGGIIRTDKMVNVNAQPSSYEISEGEVDVIRMMDNLIGFPDESVDGLYTRYCDSAVFSPLGCVIIIIESATRWSMPAMATQ